MDYAIVTVGTEHTAGRSFRNEHSGSRAVFVVRPNRVLLFRLCVTLHTGSR